MQIEKRGNRKMKEEKKILDKEQRTRDYNTFKVSRLLCCQSTVKVVVGLYFHEKYNRKQGKAQQIISLRI